MSKSSFTLAYNATPLLSPRTGIGRYAASLAAQLLAMGVPIHFFYGSGWSRQLSTRPAAAIEPAKAFVKRWLPRPYALARAAQQAAFSLGTARRHADLYHDPAGFPLRFSGPTVATVHDLSWLRFPDTHPPARVRAYHGWFEATLRRSAHLITDAESTRRELIDDFAVPPERVTAVPLAAGDAFRPRTADEVAPVLARHGLRWRGFLLSVGTVEPRKNLDAVLRAYAALDPALRRHWPLAIAGMPGWLTAQFDTRVGPLEEKGEVKRLGYVDDDELAALLAAARLLVYPSLYEGFGLPPLEAMASGTPVVTSNASSLPEVVGRAGIQVAPWDIDALGEAIRALIDDDPRWEALRSAGLARAAQFSWARCAAETLAVYRQALS
jgi:glycosyltransferase involved in cell wall biosynthesis